MVHIRLLAIAFEDYPKIFNDNDIEKKNEYLNCYITSIKKTDDFIKKVYETLKENEQKNTPHFLNDLFLRSWFMSSGRW